MDLKIDHVFKKIISYSVLHYLRDDDEILVFIGKAISLLNNGGCALFGISQIARQNLVFGTEFGKEFLKNFELKMSTHPPLVNTRIFTC